MGDLGIMAKFFALLLCGSLLGSVTAPVFAQDPAPAVDEITVPEGSEFKLQLHTTINSSTSKAGDRIMCSLIDPVAVEDRDVLPKGVRVDGHVGEARPAARKGKGGYLTIVFDTVELPNGQKVAILGSLTEVFSSESGSDPVVGPEGELKGKGPIGVSRLRSSWHPRLSARSVASARASRSEPPESSRRFFSPKAGKLPSPPDRWSACASIAT